MDGAATSWSDSTVGDLDDLKLKLAAAEARAVAAEARVPALEQQVAQLLEQLNRNSKNSHKTPSTESPAERLQRRAREKQRTKDEAKKKRGGQPGHDGAQRALLPADQVDDVVDHRPVECENC